VPRLYHHCLLLECADAAALAEALAGLPARLVVWQISETVVALDPEAADEVLALLRRAGLTPRVVTA
jgi:EAL domain-containing protein (putative c-di-GMP-specific phosphodiesterase class I)